MDEKKPWVERELRYQVAESHSLSATVHRTSKSGIESIQAELLDMSRSGLKLSIPTELEVQEVIQVHVENDGLDLTLNESAQVRWVREGTKEGTWNVGCSIQGEIDESVLVDLVENGLMDRRRDASRRHVTTDALVQWELSDEAVRVQILNLSTGGFCLAADQPTTIGARLKLMLSDDDGQYPYEILARCKWQHEFENGYLIGCELTLDNIFDLVGYFSTSDQTFTKKRRQLRFSLLTGAAIVAVGAFVYLGDFLSF